MTFSILIRPKARADIRAAALWYHQQRKGLGRTFLAAVDDSIARLRGTPRMHPIVAEEIRRSLVRRFPYCVYYQVEESRVVVIGDFHTSRDPKVWKSRVADEPTRDAD